MSVNKAISSLLENNLQEMKENFNQTLMLKAAQKLQEQKEIMSKHFLSSEE